MHGYKMLCPFRQLKSKIYKSQLLSIKCSWQTFIWYLLYFIFCHFCQVSYVLLFCFSKWILSHGNWPKFLKHCNRNNNFHCFRLMFVQEAPCWPVSTSFIFKRLAWLGFTISKTLMSQWVSSKCFKSFDIYLTDSCLSASP